MEKEAKAIPKRIVIKPGDVFCTEFDNRFKCYFQFIVKDSESLYGAVIRVFKTHYPIDYVPVIADIVKDDVAFITHTFIRFGLWDNVWYKVGKSLDTGTEALDNVVFGLAQEDRFTADNKLEKVNPLENWWVWKVNQPHIEIGRLPENFHDIIEPGSVKAYNEIRSRMEYGYYKYSGVEYDIIKRHPRPEADSYTKREHEGATYYYQFKGEYVVREVAMAVNEAVRLTPDNPVSGRYHLYTRPFGDINWLYDEFITAEEFNQVWDSSKSTTDAN
ncbi:hypothetical protein [uncultured Muribaculum sp.]|uniref:hypothetical protein n=1 Tax=uncultured Muribaculum sp. TaxID=1918613 RepID=UPI0025B7809E|nr:hypothetical protein [uncultured Muribaculum sp.]